MLWRSSPVRSRRSPPADFIVPAQPTLAAKPPAGPEWVHEVKHDGYRLIALKQADRVVLWSRNGTVFTDKLPRILRPDGHSDFAALPDQSRRERVTRHAPATVERLDTCNIPVKLSVVLGRY
jgi:hypothetical protein